MRISEVRVKLMDEPHDRLLAFCSVTFEGCFVIRDLKLIQGKNGLFVAMPSRKLTDRCSSCHAKNHLRALFCNQCGHRLRDDRAVKNDDGRSKLYADIAHPIHSECREHIQDEVLRAFEQERVLASRPGYVCLYDDFGEDREHSSADVDDHHCGGPAGRDLNRHLDPPQQLRGHHRRTAAAGGATNGRSDPEDDEFGDGLL